MTRARKTKDQRRKTKVAGPAGGGGWDLLPHLQRLNREHPEAVRTTGKPKIGTDLNPTILRECADLLKRLGDVLSNMAFMIDAENHNETPAAKSGGRK